MTLLSGFDLIANDVRAEDSGVYQCKAFSNVLAVYRTQVLCVVREYFRLLSEFPVFSEFLKRIFNVFCIVFRSLEWVDHEMLTIHGLFCFTVRGDSHFVSSDIF